VPGIYVLGLIVILRLETRWTREPRRQRIVALDTPPDRPAVEGYWQWHPVEPASRHEITRGD
jgi:hypothetical protein